MILRLDSMLVARQLAGQWACRAPTLVRLYEHGLQLVQSLRTHEHVRHFAIEHVYREFNSIADGLANEALNRRQPEHSPQHVVVDDNWTTFVLEAQLSARMTRRHHQ